MPALILVPDLSMVVTYAFAFLAIFLVTAMALLIFTRKRISRSAIAKTQAELKQEFLGAMGNRPVPHENTTRAFLQ
jgi:hypothetical protein